jgi:hypothetical protein
LDPEPEALAGRLTTGRILALVAVVGAARAFEAPTMAALLPGLVPRPMIPRAMAWSVSANQAARIAGPALGGLLYLLIGGIGTMLIATLWMLLFPELRRAGTLER